MTDQERLNEFTALIGKPPRNTTFNEQGQLIKLDLADLELTMLPAQIGQLQYLRELNLSYTKLTSLPAEIGQLEHLQLLDLSDTQLSSLPTEIGQLQHLQYLDLSWTQLRSLPAEIRQLQHLQYLDLSQIELTSLPAEIGQLQHLQQLYLIGTQLRSLPTEIGQLQHLQQLYLIGTQLRNLPTEIRELKKLEVLDLRGTTLPLPPEILEKSEEPQTILDYYFQAHQRLNEAKLLLVGQGGVGKTSLVKRLREDGFSPEEAKTEGINIQPWQIEVKRQEIRLNIWDFGGQEIMHATHQFFLTHRSLYLLVLDARQGEQEGRLEYWLKLIRSFGGDSPVIVVLNKCDQHHLTLDERGLKYKYYPNLKGFVETSCQSGVGLAELKEKISQELAQMAHVRDLMPPTWITIKSRLEAMQTDYLPYHRYLDICEEEAVQSEQEQSRLIRLLHDLGIALNYPDTRLQETSVLKPQWVTNGIYQIINSPELAHCDGMLKREQLGNILESERYPASKQLFIIDIMRKFELCFAVEGKPDEQFLIPDLLPKEQPDFMWPHQSNLAFEYHYDILPGSILSRFIVRMHSYMLPQKAWRSGVVLADGDNQALILADREDGKIYISVGGQERSRRAFLTAIRFQFEHIHRTITGIKAEQMIPLSGYPKEAIAYQALLSYEKAGEFNPWWPSINARLNVKQLLDGVGRVEQKLAQDEHRHHRANESVSAEAWRENRWLREEEARKEEARKVEEERQRAEEIRKEEARRIEEERQRAEEERKRLEMEAEEQQQREYYEELVKRRAPLLKSAQQYGKKMTITYIFVYVIFCLLIAWLLGFATDKLPSEFESWSGAIELLMGLLVFPGMAFLSQYLLKLESLSPKSIYEQLEMDQFWRECETHHFPEAEYQQLTDEFEKEMVEG